MEAVKAVVRIRAKNVIREEKYWGEAGFLARGVLAISIRAEIHKVRATRDVDIKSANNIVESGFKDC